MRRLGNPIAVDERHIHVPVLDVDNMLDIRRKGERHELLQQLFENAAQSLHAVVWAVHDNLALAVGRCPADCF